MKKILLIFFMLCATRVYAGECIGSCFPPTIDTRSLLEELLEHRDERIDESQMQNDSRQIYDGSDPSAPDFLESYGKLIVKHKDGVAYTRCTGNLVIRETWSDEPAPTESDIVTTAAHCFHDDADIESSYISFTNKRGQQFKRHFLVVEKGNINSDFAILKLDEPISMDDITPLMVGEPIAYIYKERKSLTLGGYSSDSYKGHDGEVLTYDQNCEVTYADSATIHTTCSAYYGSSGGALVIEAVVDGTLKPYIVGVCHGPFNRRADRIQVTGMDCFYRGEKPLEEWLGVIDEW